MVKIFFRSANFGKGNITTKQNVFTILDLLLQMFLGYLDNTDFIDIEAINRDRNLFYNNISYRKIDLK